MFENPHQFLGGGTLGVVMTLAFQYFIFRKDKTFEHMQGLYIQMRQELTKCQAKGESLVRHDNRLRSLCIKHNVPTDQLNGSHDHVKFERPGPDQSDAGEDQQ